MDPPFGMYHHERRSSPPLDTFSNLSFREAFCGPHVQCRATPTR